MWAKYGVICHEGSTTQEVIVMVMARDVEDAKRRVLADGFTPIRACLAFVKY